jgi:hypothetical protein
MRHRLPRFLCEAFGGSTSLVDVRVGRDPLYQAVCPLGDGRVQELNVAGAASYPTALASHGEHDAATEIKVPRSRPRSPRRWRSTLQSCGESPRRPRYVPRPSADVSHTDSGPYEVIAASKSRRPTASMARRFSSTRSGIVDSSDAMRASINYACGYRFANPSERLGNSRADDRKGRGPGVSAPLGGLPLRDDKAVVIERSVGAPARRLYEEGPAVK